MTGLDLSTLALPLLLTAAAILLASGVPGLFLGWRSPWGPRLAACLVALGSLLGVAGAALALFSSRGSAGLARLSFPLSFQSSLPGVRGELGADPLSAFFAVPVFVVGSLGAVYGLRYWRPAEHPRNGRRLRFCYGLLLASMVLVTLARDGISFLIAWEAMAVSAFFLVVTEDRLAATRSAGWRYLLFSHAGTLCLVACFVLLAGIAGIAGTAGTAGTFALRPLATVSPVLGAAVFALAIAGFGVKAGIMPFHSWLPGAHAAAPSHVSAVMSGVMIKMGLYGILRVGGLLPATQPSWGVTLVGLGAISSFFGIVFALGQRDLKKLLAYSTIENSGIMLMAIGLAMAGRSLGRADWVLLGLAGCLLHVWNHALFKPLLFYSAGAVAHAAGSRDIERMGGLAKRMPVTAACFLVGAVAICGLPPLNGFVSELFLYLGLVRTAAGGGPSWLPAALAAPVLAAVGALAVACFVKVYGIVFLGVPRGAAAAKAHEAGGPMLAPMVGLAAACAFIGLAPWAVVPAVEAAAFSWAPQGTAPAPTLAVLAPLEQISALGLLLVAGLAALSLLVLPAVRRSRRREPELPTWGCGYAGDVSKAAARIQYTGSSFADLITSRFAWLVRPEEHRPRLLDLFPAGGERYASHAEDPVLQRLIQPAARAALRLSGRLRAAHQGQMQRYVLYIALAVALLLLSNLPFRRLLAEISGPRGEDRAVGGSVQTGGPSR